MSSGSASGSRSTISRLQRAAKSPRLVEDEGHGRRSCRRRSCGRCGPMTTAAPPVMYSQQWSPVPSTTAMRAAVAHAEPLAGPAAEEGLAAGRAVERDVADQDVVLGDEPCRSWEGRR